MLQYGLHITKADDKLNDISVERIFHAIKHPKLQMRNRIERLRIVREMDVKQYSRLKKELPYFTCGRFHPAVRRSAHFASIQSFMIDLDHFGRSNMTKESVFDKLTKDEQVVMMFTSPGGDGLKIMYHLADQCVDAGLYSLFYKAFLHSFSKKHHLDEVIDVSTSDVTRACFLSVDEGAYFNPEAVSVNMNAYFNQADPDAQYQTERRYQELAAHAPERDNQPNNPLTNDILTEIKKKLNPNFRPQKPKQIYVPEELNDVFPEIEQHLEQLNISINKVEAINFGKKLTVGAGRYWAEVNIFYGKKGYSIVKTPKSGSNADLAELVHQVLFGLLVDDSGFSGQIDL